MGQDVEVSCRCGAVHGRVSDVSHTTVNRAVCFCDDCQAYVHWLHRPDLLDAHAGSDVIQVAPAALSFDRGQDRIRCVRLSPKGLYRWYASCCNTPVGNSLTPAIPFIGIYKQSFAGGPALVDEAFGASRGAVFGKFAVGDAPKDSLRLNLALIGASIWRVLGFRLRGKTWPHPFFEHDGKARYAITTLERTERDALRPLCGPRPAQVQSAHV